MRIETSIKHLIVIYFFLVVMTPILFPLIINSTIKNLVELIGDILIMLATPSVPFDLMACNRNKIKMSKNAWQTQGTTNNLADGALFLKEFNGGDGGSGA